MDDEKALKTALRSQIDFLRYTRRYVALNNPAYAPLTHDINALKRRLGFTLEQWRNRRLAMMF